MEKISAKQFIFSKENILVNAVLGMNTLSILKYHKTYKSFIIASMLLLIYFIFSDRKDKIITLIVMLNFSFWGILGESYIIKKNGVCRICYKKSFAHYLKEKFSI